MEILISNEQDVPVDDKLLLRVARIALAHEKVEDDVELSIALVDEDEIRGLNAHYRSQDSVTDVLSFETEDEEPGTSEYPHLLGDVVICPSVAARQAEEYGQSFEQEMALLLTHGILHLLGYDHQDDTEAEIMEGHEKEILADEK
ncbi:MAG: rRNA maturation RNase YbeY [Candidatus Aquicultor sp.]